MPQNPRKTMEAVIMSFRRGVNTQKDNQMILKVAGVITRADAEKLVGKTVTWTSSGKNEIKGKIAAAHGNSGAVRAIFERGMPGQSQATKVVVA